MNVSELIERLSECDPNAEVRLATQPNWPLASMLDGVADSADVTGESMCEEHSEYGCSDCTPAVVWLTEGAQPDDSPYAPRAAWSVAR
jgi:hypothetical protein